MFSLTGSAALTQANGVAGSLFGSGMANGLAVVSGVGYEFEVFASVIKSSTSANVTFTIGGTATYFANPYMQSLTNVAGTTAFTSANSTTISLASGSTATSFIIRICGRFHVTAGGNFMPQITFSAGSAPSQATSAGAYVRVTPISTSSGINSIGAWS
jgi:hypothetical protein